MKPEMSLLAIVTICLVSPQNAAPQTTVTLDLRQGVPVVDEVFLNGNGPYRFLLDTGSQSNELDPRVASKLGIESTLSFVMNTPAGQTSVHGGRLKAVQVGPMKAFDQEVLFTSFAGVSKRCPGVVGILGQEFLGKFDYFLDLRHRRLMPAPPPSTGTRVPVRMVSGSMAVETNLGYLLLDSGAETMLLFGMSLRTQNNFVQTTAGPPIAVSTETARFLEIGHRTYYVGRVNFAPPPGIEVAGLLPATVFQAIYVSNSEKYLVLEPKLPD